MWKITRDQNLKKISEKFVIEKFTNKNISENQWLIFLKNNGVKEDVQKI